MSVPKLFFFWKIEVNLVRYKELNEDITCVNDIFDFYMRQMFVNFLQLQFQKTAHSSY